MRIKRVYKETSLKAGQETEIDEEKMKEISSQADTFRIDPIVKQKHMIGQSGVGRPFLDVMRHLRNGETVETFFSSFTMIKV